MLRTLLLQSALLGLRPGGPGGGCPHRSVRGALLLQGAGFFFLGRRGGCIGSDRGVFGLFLCKCTLFFTLRGSAFLGLLFQRGALLQALCPLLFTLRPLGDTRLPIQFVRLAFSTALRAVLLTLGPIHQTRLPLQLLLGRGFTPQLVSAHRFLLEQRTLLLREGQLLLLDGGQCSAP